MKDGKSFFIDTSSCIACRGCQAACKEWNQLTGGKTVNRGTPQNPEDFNYNTWKLVRFTEVNDEKLRWNFFPDQCRHCLEPACKKASDKKVRGAIERDEATGAVIFNPEIRVRPSDFKDIREACPYDIPRIDLKQGKMAFCNMCIDRIREGSLPACVKICPTGAMNFGERKAMLDLANRKVAEAKAERQKAILTDPDSTRVIFLLVDDPENYHELAVADQKALVSHCD